MYQQPVSPQDNSNDSNVRFLIDQRAARAAFPSNFSISDYDDSPSIYSHAAFSPRSHQQDLPSLGSPLSPARSTAVSHKERLNDPALSSLDLDDDPRSSYASSEYDQDLDAEETASGAEDESLSRISIMGPRMRFHSPAPWEEGSPISEEPEPSSSNYLSAARNGVRKLGFSSSSSMKPSSAPSRPSTESVRSQQPKHSFETSSSGSSQSRGATIQPQAAMSSTSLALSVKTPSTSHSLLNKLSLGSGRPQTPTAPILPPQAQPTPSPYSSGYNSEHDMSHHQSPYRPATVSDHSESHYRYSTAWPPRDDDDKEESQSHPYANPEAAVYYPQDARSSSDSRATSTPAHLATVSRSDSSFTITESSTVSSSMTKVAPETPLPLTRNKLGAFHGKEISSPFSPGVTPDSKIQPTNPAWTDGKLVPSIQLISLEEAQQQVRRSRSATVEGRESTHIPPSIHSSSSGLPFPELHRDLTHSPEKPSFLSSRQRSRSISAGVRAKNVLSTMKSGVAVKPERRDSEPAVLPSAPAKPLRHKKSGFMRLFNGREKEKEDREVPPVPSLSEAFAGAGQTYQPSLAVRKPSIPTTRRVPVPALDPLSSTPDSRSRDLERITSSQSSSPLPSPKRTPPLYINTSQSQVSVPVINSPSSMLEADLSPGSIREGFWRRAAFPPSSAPANVTSFNTGENKSQIPSLSLRPISTTFSSQFGDRFMAKPSLTPALEEDGMATSPTSATSLATPVLPLRLNVGRDGKADGQDPSAVIIALQEQIAADRTAWQRQVWELEGEVRDLKTELEEARFHLGHDKEYCELCGRGPPPIAAGTSVGSSLGRPDGVMNRPRARTAVAHRFVSS